MATTPDDIEALTSAWEPTLRKAFLEAVKDHRDHINRAELVRLLESGDIEAAIALASPEPEAFLPLDRAIEAAFVAGGLAVALAAARRLAFNHRSASAQLWLVQHTSDLTRRIAEDQRALVRSTLTPLDARSPEILANDLLGRISTVTRRREGGALGLTAQQAAWARAYEAELTGVPSEGALKRKLRDKRFDRLVQKAIREDAPIPADTRRAMVAAYRNRALRLRADDMALSEASAALHQAQVEAWRQAIDKGFIAAGSVRRFWVTVGDDRVRPTHRAVPGMNLNGVGLFEPFQTPKGLAMQPGWSFDPGCRCHARVRVVSLALAA